MNPNHYDYINQGNDANCGMKNNRRNDVYTAGRSRSWDGSGDGWTELGIEIAAEHKSPESWVELEVEMAAEPKSPESWENGG